MPTRLIISDLDSTLFDTPKFFDALPQAIETVFGAQHVEADVFEREMRDRSHYAAAGYDLAAHLTAYSLELNHTSSGALIKALQGRFGSFVYQDVPEFIARIRETTDTDLAIVTVGVPSAQEFKFALCAAELSDIPYEITEHNKGALLSKYWSAGIRHNGVVYESAAVVDDSASQLTGLEHSSNVELVQIYRENQRHPRSNDPRIDRVVSSLSEVL